MMTKRANPKKLHQRLRLLWDKRTNPTVGEVNEFAKWRYVPQAFSADGPGWAVFDRLEDRFLAEAEVVAIPLDRLLTASHLS